MNKKLELILLEDDPLDCHEVESAVKSKEDEFILLATTNDSDQCVELVLRYKPDVVLLDLELHRGKGSGLDFLQKLHLSCIEDRPFILITTNNISQIVHDMARTLGADFIITKSQADYSADMVLEVLSLLRTTVLKKRHHVTIETQIKESEAQRRKRVRSKITNALLTLGINPRDKGFNYLVDGIFLTLKGPVSHLCMEIAKFYNKTEPSVERAMHNAINRAWQTMDYDHLLKCYTAHIKSERGVPTITEFVHYFANKFNNEY